MAEDSGNGSGNDSDNPSGNDGEESWLDGISEEYRDNPSLKKFEDVSGLAKGYINAESMIGRDKIPMPTNDAEMIDVMNRLGRPEEIAGYELQAPENLPEGLVFDDEMQTSFLEAAHSLNLTKDQVAGMSTWYWGAQQGLLEKQTATTESGKSDAEAELKEKWGNAYDKNVGIASRTMKEFSDDATVEYLQKSGLGNNPVLVRLFSEIGHQMLEDGQLTGDGLSSGRTPDEINAEIQSSMALPAYINAKHPEHKLLVSKVQKLYNELSSPTV